MYQFRAAEGKITRSAKMHIVLFQYQFDHQFRH